MINGKLSYLQSFGGGRHPNTGGRRACRPPWGNLAGAAHVQRAGHHHDKRQTFILAIDEAQYLSIGILNDIKMLMNYGYDSVNCFSLILCGESHLNSILTRPVNEALRQRITVHYNYAGLSDTESAAYIVHKLSCAGSSKSIIEEAAIDAVSSQAHGNPRLIDNIMSDALAIGTQLEKKCIDTDVILASVNNQNLYV